MPLISVITAAYAPTAKYITETASSIQAQELPSGWAVEWVVQEDGDRPSLGEKLKSVPNVRYAANDTRLGIAPTRNTALARASGTLVQALDQDDVLLPGAFKVLVPLFEEYRIHWAIGQADDLMPDGTRKPFKTPIPFGVLSAGWVNQWAEERGGNWPIHGGALLMRATSLRALGGWSGIPHDDEIAMFAALSEVTDGYHHSALTWLYRQHELQTHRTEEVQRRSAACRRFALQRAKAVRATGLTFDPLTPVGFSNVADVRVGPAVKEQAK